MHPISPRSDEEATVYVLAKAESKAYLAPSTFRNIDYEERFERIAPRVPSIACALFIDRESPIENPDHTTFSSVLETYTPHKELYLKAACSYQNLYDYIPKYSSSTYGHFYPRATHRAQFSF